MGHRQRMWLPSGAWSLPQAVLGVLLVVSTGTQHGHVAWAHLWQVQLSQGNTSGPDSEKKCVSVMSGATCQSHN